MCTFFSDLHYIFDFVTFAYSSGQKGDRSHSNSLANASAFGGEADVEGDRPDDRRVHPMGSPHQP